MRAQIIRNRGKDRILRVLSLLNLSVPGRKFQLEDFFSEDFMKAYTRFSCIDHFLGGYSRVGDLPPEREVGSEQWDNYVRLHTSFGNWDSMKSQAIKGWVAANLKDSSCCQELFRD